MKSSRSIMDQKLQKQIEEAEKRRVDLQKSLEQGDEELNKLRQSLATARAKPDGLLRLRAADAAELLHDEPVRTLPDCGHDREEKLGAIGITTCGDLVAADASRLRKAVGPKVAEKLLASAWASPASHVPTATRFWHHYTAFPAVYYR